MGGVTDLVFHVVPLLSLQMAGSLLTMFSHGLASVCKHPWVPLPFPIWTPVLLD